MAVFAYHALDVSERLRSGMIAADTAALARQALRARGLTVAGITECQPAGGSGWRRLVGNVTLRSKRRDDSVAELWSNLAVLLEAGVPLAESLDVCLRQQGGSARHVLQQALEAVRNGQSLADALALHGTWFDELTLAVVRVGQRAGSLAAALSELAEYQGRRRAAVNRLSAALIYPTILCVVGLAVVTFLMGQVIPQLLDVLASAGRALPAPTRLLKALSDALIGWWPMFATGAGGFAAALATARKTERGRRWLERMALAIPVVGDLLRKAWIARASLMLATLLRSDVRFTEALHLVRVSLPHRLLADELVAVERGIEAGASIADALRGSRLLPPLVVHLLMIGQESGELPRMLDRLRVAYEQKVQLAVGRLLAVLEPTLILVLAIVIGFVVFATLLPILETTRMAQ